MTSRTRVYIYCDGPRCVWEDPAEGDENQSVTSLRSELRVVGWRRIAGKDSCPDCVTEMREGVR